MAEIQHISSTIQAIAAILTPALAAILFWIYEHRKEKLEKAKAFRELFNEFNKRFDKLNKKLNKIREASLNGTTLPKKYEATIQDYLNLCAEEYLWSTEKYRSLIDCKIWSSWLEGIDYYLAAPLIKDYFRIELTGSAQKSYYGLAQELEKKLK